MPTKDVIILVLIKVQGSQSEAPPANFALVFDFYWTRSCLKVVHALFLS